MEFFYLVVSSKWKNIYNLQSLKVYLHWRKIFFKDKFEELTPDGIETTNLFCQDKIREKGRNLDDTGEPFFHIQSNNSSSKRKLDDISEVGEKIIKFVKRLVIKT